MSSSTWNEIEVVDNLFKGVKKWFKSDLSGTVVPETLLPQPSHLWFEDFKARSDDTYIVSYPKCGSSWIQEIIWLILNNVDVETAKKSKADDRAPFIDLYSERLSSDFYDKLPSPRILKTHFSYEHLPKQVIEKKCKIIYIVRNPKDVCVSYYHFTKMVSIFGYTGTFEQFFQLFIKDEVPYGSFWHNVKSFWNRNEDNILFVKYEDFQKNFIPTTKKIGEFFKIDLSDDDYKVIQEHCSYNKMKGNPATNYQHFNKSGLITDGNSPFMRKGIVGDWKDYFTDEMMEIMNQWVEKNTKGTGLTFDYEI